MRRADGRLRPSPRTSGAPNSRVCAPPERVIGSLQLMAIMRLTSGWVTGVAWLGLAVVLLGCAVPPDNSATPDEMIENYQERFPLAPIPRSEVWIRSLSTDAPSPDR